MNLEKICLQVVDLTKNVGQFILSEKNNIKQLNVEVKGLHDFVTYVDKTSEQKLVDKLSELLPEAGFIAEEGTSTKKGEKYNWIIDPLDGTVNFLHGVPHSCVSVAVAKEGVVLAGGVFDPFRNELFMARRGKGATRNGRRIHVSKESNLRRSLLITGFPYDRDRHAQKYLRYLEPFLKKSMG